MLVWPLLSCTLCALISTSIGGEEGRYDNYQLIEFTPQSAIQRRVFEKLQHHGNGPIFLQSSPREGVPWLAAVAPQLQHVFRKHLKHIFGHRVVHNDLQSLIATSDKQQNIAPQAVDWKSYQTLESIYAWLDKVQLDHPQQVTGIVVGTSYEKRQLRGVRIAFGTSAKPGVFIEGGIHAREWIGPAFCTYLINQLLTSTDPAIREVAESHVWYVVPSVNPDGYVYTNTDRLWRKTRSPALNILRPRCKGADPNRNWDVQWNTVGTSSNQCDETFAGREAFSEVEMKSLAQYLEGLRDKLHVYISFHAYSQLLLYPYGYTDRDVAIKTQLQTIGMSATNALYQVHGTEYTVGPISTTIYPVSGSTVDYAYEKLGIPVSYTYELRPKSSGTTNGFALPAAEIIPVGEETMASVVALLNTAKSMGFDKVT